MRKKENPEKQKDSPVSNKQRLFMVMFVLLAALSIFAVAAQSREFSLADFGEYIQNASVPWLIVAGICMLGFIFFEAFALMVLCRARNRKPTLWQGFIYSASDVYFSAITPSATGGQPASAYFMMKDGFNSMLSTAILIANLCMYTLAIVIVGGICLIFRFDIFLQYSLLSQILIIGGFLIQVALLLFFIMVLKKEQLLHKICTAVLRFLCKLRLVKNRERKQRRLDGYMERYRRNTRLITEHPKAMALCLLFNFLQRGSQIAVTMFVYIATTGKGIAESLDLLFWQSYVVLGANVIPVPGAVGVSDYMMLDGFGKIMSESQAVNLELLSRSLSFYSCVIICGISIVIQYCVLKKRGKRE